MDVEVKPAAEPTELRAITLAVAQADMRARGAKLYDVAWRRAGLQEGRAGGDDDEDAAYALSPRRTRGATRA